MSKIVLFGITQDDNTVPLQVSDDGQLVIEGGGGGGEDPRVDDILIRLADVESEITNLATQDDIAELQSAISDLNTALANTPDLNDYQELVDEIASLTTAIQGKADVSSVNALADAVAALTTAIDDKASQEDLDALSTALSTLTTEVATKVTTSAMNTAISAAINNIKIDSVNHLRNSGLFKNINHWNTTLPSAVSLVAHDNLLTMTKLNNTTGVHIVEDIAQPIIDGKQYQLRVRVKSNVVNNFYVAIERKSDNSFVGIVNSPGLPMPVANQYYDFVITFTADSRMAGDCWLAWTSSWMAVGELTFEYLYLEEATKISNSWRPNHLDIYATIAQAIVTANSYTDTRATEIYGVLDGFNDTITTLATTVNGKAEATALSALADYVNQVATLAQTADTKAGKAVIPVWAQVNAYAINEQVVYNNEVYISNKAIAANTVWSLSNFNKLTPSASAAKISGMHVKSGQQSIAANTAEVVTWETSPTWGTDLIDDNGYIYLSNTSDTRTFVLKSRLRIQASNIFAAEISIEKRVGSGGWNSIAFKRTPFNGESSVYLTIDTLDRIASNNITYRIIVTIAGDDIVIDDPLDVSALQAYEV